jgi:hypothetical protein
MTLPQKLGIDPVVDDRPMKPTIRIEGFDIKCYEANIRVMYNGSTLLTAYDFDYESGDAKKCCMLLAAMRDAGIINLSVNEEAAKQWVDELKPHAK